MFPVLFVREGSPVLAPRVRVPYRVNILCCSIFGPTSAYVADTRWYTTDRVVCLPSDQQVELVSNRFWIGHSVSVQFIISVVADTRAVFPGSIITSQPTTVFSTPSNTHGKRGNTCFGSQICHQPNHCSLADRSVVEQNTSGSVVRILRGRTGIAKCAVVYISFSKVAATGRFGFRFRSFVLLL